MYNVGDYSVAMSVQGSSLQCNSRDTACRSHSRLRFMCHVYCLLREKLHPRARVDGSPARRQLRDGNRDAAHGNHFTIAISESCMTRMAVAWQVHRLAFVVRKWEDQERSGHPSGRVKVMKKHRVEARPRNLTGWSRHRFAHTYVCTALSPC